MSQSNLLNILNELESTSSKEFRRTVGDRLVTTMYLTVKLIMNQVEYEVLHSSGTKKGTLPAKLISQLEPLASECYANIIKGTVSSSVVNFEPYGDGVILIADGSGSNFDAIYRITQPATRVLYNKIQNVLKSARLQPLGANLFDIGHVEGSNVDIQIGKAIAPAIDDPNVQRFLNSIPISEVKHILSVASEFNSLGGKSYIVRSILEAKGPNRAKQEAAFRAAFLKSLKKFVAENDWANQESSDSVNQNIKKKLINTAIKAGAKGVLQKESTAPSSATITEIISGPKSKNAVFDPEVNDLKVEDTRSLVSLIPILNSSLPEAVRLNMTGGRLHNRTGRLSESARIVSITETSQGFPLVNYTYQRSPYDVFDSVLGRYPWNTPGRDPKSLITKSIRDIAKDLITERFYVARSSSG